MSLTVIRNAIVTKLAAVPNIGIVHAYERYTQEQAKFAALYKHEGKILGWNVRRLSTREIEGATTFNREIHRWQIRGYSSLVDDTASELVFDNLVEAVRAAFRNDETIGGTVETTAADGLIGLQLDDSGPVMLGGILCHGVRLTLATQAVVEIGSDGELVPFITGNIKIDTATPDGTAESEDNITLEQP